MQTETMHIGRKISRIRELRGMKQETLAAEMGVSQQAISKLEQSEHVDDDRLQMVAEKLGVSVEGIKNFDEDKAIHVIQNNYEGSNNQGPNLNYQCTFNPLEELRKSQEEVKKLHQEKVELYERMLKDKTEMIEKLEQMLLQKK